MVQKYYLILRKKLVTNVEIKMRFNADTEEVETLVDGKVLVASGKEAFASWAKWHADKYQPTVDEPVEHKVIHLDEPVEEEPVNPDEPVVEENLTDDEPV